MSTRLSNGVDVSHFPEWATVKNYDPLIKLDLLGWFLNLRPRLLLWEARNIDADQEPSWAFLTDKLYEQVVGKVIIPTEDDRKTWETKSTVWTAAAWETASWLKAGLSYGTDFFRHDTRMSTLNQKIAYAVQKQQQEPLAADPEEGHFQTLLHRAYRHYKLEDKYRSFDPEGELPYPLESKFEEATLFAGVNLAHPREQILRDFSEWLKKVKTDDQATKKAWEKQWNTQFLEWNNKYIIQWLDLTLWAKKEGINFKHDEFYAIWSPPSEKYIEKMIRPGVVSAMERLWELRQAL